MVKRITKRLAAFLLMVVFAVALVPVMPAMAASTIKLGDYVQMGTYYGEPILWRCVSFEKISGYDNAGNPIIDSTDTVTEYKDGYLPLMLSDKIICLKPFDASGTGGNESHGRNSNKYYSRDQYGSNYWFDSNIRSWLNSKESAENVKWLCGNPPSNDYVWRGYNDYDKEAGFLTHFSHNEINLMHTTVQKSIVACPEVENNLYTMGTERYINNSNIDDVIQNYDDAYAENVTDYMFFLDTQQINNVYKNSNILGNDYYIGKPTKKAVNNSEFKDSGLSDSNTFRFWLRTPVEDNIHIIRYVNCNGSIEYNDARGGNWGVRPAFFLEPSITFKFGNGSINEPYALTLNHKFSSLNNTSKINGRGQAYLRYQLLDTNENPIANKAVYCKYDGYDMQSDAVTDNNGVAVFVTPELTSSTTLNLEIKASDGTEISNNIQTANITVENLSYSQTWSGQFGKGVKLEAAWGANGRLGPGEAGAKVASASINGKASEGLTLKEIYNKGVRGLELSSITDTELSGKLNAGLWANAQAFKKFGAEIKAGQLGAGAAFGADQTRTLKIENYDPTNVQQLAQIAYFLTGATSKSQINVLIRQIAEYFADVKAYNEESNSYTLTATAGADIGNISTDATDIVSGGLYTIGGDNVWNSSYRKDIDGNMVYSSSFGTSAEHSIGNINLSISNNNTNTDFKYGTSVYGSGLLNNNAEISAETNNGTVKELKLSMLERSETGGFLWGINNKNHAKQFTYADNQAKKIINNNADLLKLSQGNEGFMNPRKISNAVDSILTSDASGEYARNKRVDKGFDIDMGLGFTIGVGPEVDAELSGIGGYEFEYENGIVSDGIIYIQSTSTAESDIIANKKAFNEILAEPIQYIADVISNRFSSITGKVKDTVNKGKAVVQGISDWTATIFSSDNTNAQSYAVLSVDNEASLLSTASVSTTVGNPYVIEIKDSDENIVTDFSESPLKLTLQYDNDDLSIAGLAAEDSENLKIYWFDTIKGVYTCMGGTLDTEAQSVITDIIYPGQYILAADNCSPSVTGFTVSDYTQTPTFKATVADMSGIGDFSFKIDGKEFVNEDNLYNYYSDTDAVFEYKCSDNLADGKHTASIIASDTAGNKMAMEIILEFNIDAKAPNIENTEFNIKNDGTLNISAEVQDDNTSSVIAYIETDDTVYTYPLELDTDKWTTEIEVPLDITISAWVEAYDLLGNITVGEKQIISPEETINPIGKYADNIIIKKNIINNTITFNITPIEDNQLSDITLFSAEYDENDNLAGVKIGVGTLSEGSLTITIPKGVASKQRFMIWDDSYTPLCEVIEVK